MRKLQFSAAIYAKIARNLQRFWLRASHFSVKKRLTCKISTSKQAALRNFSLNRYD